MRSLFTCLVLALATAAAEVPVIPRPLEIRETEARLRLSNDSTVHIGNPADSTLFLATVSEAAGFPLRATPADARASIQFLDTDSLPKQFPIPKGEGYVIHITGEVANVHAATPAGHFHGLQTLAQLIRAAERDGQGAISLPGTQIVDAPRFAWRGFMLDESRHFTGETGVKRLLDGMARYFSGGGLLLQTVDRFSNTISYSYLNASGQNADSSTTPEDARVAGIVDSWGNPITFSSANTATAAACAITKA